MHPVPACARPRIIYRRGTGVDRVRVRGHVHAAMRATHGIPATRAGMEACRFCHFGRRKGRGRTLERSQIILYMAIIIQKVP